MSPQSRAPAARQARAPERRRGRLEPGRLRGGSRLGLHRHEGRLGAAGSTGGNCCSTGAVPRRFQAPARSRRPLRSAARVQALQAASVPARAASGSTARSSRSRRQPTARRGASAARLRGAASSAAGAASTHRVRLERRSVDRLGHRFHDGLRRSFDRGRCGGHRRRCTDLPDAGDQVVRRGDVQPRVRHLAHAVQFVDRCLQHVERRCVAGGRAGLDRREERFDFVAQVAHGANARHARTALQRMQQALELGDLAAIGTVGAPVRERRLGLLEQLGGLLAEDRGDVRVEVLGQPRFDRRRLGGLGTIRQASAGGARRSAVGGERRPRWPPSSPAARHAGPCDRRRLPRATPPR